MAKVTFASLKLKEDVSTTSFEFNGANIEVKNYLPIEDKYNLIMVALKDSESENIFNPLMLDMHFHMNLVYEYTNLTFTDKQRENESKLYDQIQSSGLLAQILKAIPEQEYINLVDFLNETMSKKIEFNNSFASAFTRLTNDLPEKMKEASEILSKWDMNQFKEVIQFAQSSNNGQPIPEA